MSILQIKNVSKKLGDTVIVDNISIDIQQGEFITLLGPSGCGKTTLLRMIAGFLTPDSGEILLNNINLINLPPEKRPLHTIFQSYALFPHLTVFENIAFPLKMAKWNKQQIVAQVNEVLEDVDLTKYAKRYPNEISGGQKQRVAIARSLVDRPKLLLLDEPLSALDAQLRERMHIELVKLQQETGVTFVYVTHDQSEALALSTRIAVMNLGRIEQLGHPVDIYSKPETHFVADFLGKCNILPAVILAITATSMRLKIANMFEIDIKSNNPTYTVGDTGSYAIRPEKIKLKRNNSEIDSTDIFMCQGIINDYYYYGDVTLYELCIADKINFKVELNNSRTTQAEFFAQQSQVHLVFDPNAGTFILDK